MMEDCITGILPAPELDLDDYIHTEIDAYQWGGSLMVSYNVVNEFHHPVDVIVEVIDRTNESFVDSLDLVLDPNQEESQSIQYIFPRDVWIGEDIKLCTDVIYADTVGWQPDRGFSDEFG